jgi:hypothetical protein
MGRRGVKRFAARPFCASASCTSFFAAFLCLSINAFFYRVGTWSAILRKAGPIRQDKGTPRRSFGGARLAVRVEHRASGFRGQSHFDLPLAEWVAVFEDPQERTSRNGFVSQE